MLNVNETRMKRAAETPIRQRLFRVTERKTGETAVELGYAWECAARVGLMMNSFKRALETAAPDGSGPWVIEFIRYETDRERHDRAEGIHIDEEWHRLEETRQRNKEDLRRVRRPRHIYDVVDTDTGEKILTRVSRAEIAEYFRVAPATVADWTRTRGGYPPQDYFEPERRHIVEV